MNIRSYLRRGAALTLAAVLCGCSNMEPKLSAAADKASDVYSQLSSIAVENRAPLVIHLWHGFNEQDAAALEEITEEFNKTVGEENHVHVQLTAYEGVEAVEQAVYDAIREEETKTDDLRRLPDLFFALDDTAYRMDRMSLSVHMDELLPEETINFLLDAVKPEAFPGEYDAMALLPVALDSTVLLVNENEWMDFCAAASTETVAFDSSSFATWEEITTAAKAYQQWNLQPAEGEEAVEITASIRKRRSFFAADSWGSLMIASYRGEGGTMFSVDEESVKFDFVREKVRPFWDFWYGGAINGLLAETGSREAFVSGDAVACLVSTSKACDYNNRVKVADTDRSSLVEIGVYQTPSFEEGIPVTIQETLGLVALKGNQEHQDSVKIFLRYLTDPQRLAEIAVSTGRLPTLKTSVSDQVLQSAFEAQSLSGLEQMILMQAKEQLYSHIQHSLAVFVGGSDLVKTMDEALLRTAGSMSNRYETVVSSGIDPQQAYDLMSTDIQFDRWYTAFRDELVELVLLGGNS